VPLKLCVTEGAVSEHAVVDIKIYSKVISGTFWTHRTSSNLNCIRYLITQDQAHAHMHFFNPLIVTICLATFSNLCGSSVKRHVGGTSSDVFPLNLNQKD
jgi:hypothetical protein